MRRAARGREPWPRGAAVAWKAILLGLALMSAVVAGDSTATKTAKDSLSDPDFLSYLNDHVNDFLSTLETTKEMYHRISLVSPAAAATAHSDSPSPIRITAKMMDEGGCAESDSYCAKHKFIADRLMPAAIQEISRRFLVTKPVSGKLRLPRQCKSVLPTGNCAEVTPLNSQVPMCQDPELYAGYELCNYVDGNLHCVTMLGGSGVEETDFLLRVDLDKGMPSPIVAFENGYDDPGFSLNGAFGQDGDEDGGQNDGGFAEIPDWIGRRLMEEEDTYADVKWTDMCGYTGTMAVTGQCGYDLETSRPLIGYINFCPSTIDITGNFDEMLEGAIHQIIHAMYMSGSLVQLYEPTSNGGKSYANGGDMFSTSPPVLHTPAVVEAARTHFGCDSITGLELELIPGHDDLLGSHWAAHALSGELMTPHGGVRPSVLSPITMALASDSGWYTPWGVVKDGLLHYGAGAGCDFMLQAKSCDSATAVVGSSLFCPEAGTTPTCTPGGYGHGLCSEIDGMDNCFAAAADGAFHDCRDPASASGMTKETMFGVYHGYHSRCLDVAEDITIQLGMTTETLDAGAQCFKFECQGPELFVVLGFVQVRCPTGEMISVGDLDINAGFRSGQLGPCPDNELTCGALACPNECSGHGHCDPSVGGGEPPACSCDIGFGFSRLGAAGEDCSASLTCDTDADCGPLSCDPVTHLCGFSTSLTDSDAHPLLAAGGLTKSIPSLLGAVTLVATPAVDDRFLAHAAAVLANLLDLDQDGEVDDPALLEAMLAARPLVAVYADEADREAVAQAAATSLGSADLEALEKLSVQDVYASEMVVGQPSDGDGGNVVDAALHSALLLLYESGWARAYPDLEGAVSSAMDEAAGDCGYFFCYDNEACGAWAYSAEGSCSGVYHDGGDRGCDRGCLLPEYFALALTAASGTFDLQPEACAVLGDVWSVCSAAELQSANPKFFDAVALLKHAAAGRRLLADGPLGLLSPPHLPFGQSYRQYDASTFHLAQSLSPAVASVLALAVDDGDGDGALVQQARYNSDDSEEKSSEADSSEASDSSSDKSESPPTFYGSSDSDSELAPSFSPPSTPSFYSMYGYLAEGGQAKAGNNLVVVGGAEPGGLEDRQTWEQLVLGLLKSMEGTQEGDKEDAATSCVQDRFSQCCDAPNGLDAAQGCCTTGVDACGVCNGGDSSCALQAVVRVLAKEDLEIEMLVGRLKSELGLMLANYMITPDHIVIDIKNMEQVTRRKLLAASRRTVNSVDEWGGGAPSLEAPDRRLALEAGWVQVDVPFSVFPPDYTSDLEQPLVSSAADYLAQIDPEQLGEQPADIQIVSTVQVDVTGVCGNFICEFGEMGTPGEPGSCPQDCPVVNALSPDSNALEEQTCPDIAAACAGDDAQACFEATMAATSAECLAQSGAGAVEASVPPITTSTIMPCPLDAEGNCCDAPASLDAARVCCRELLGVDECGVCGGQGKSCATLAMVQVAAPPTLEVADFVAFVQTAVVEYLAKQGINASSVEVDVDKLVRLPQEPGCNLADGVVVVPAGVVADAAANANSTACQFGSDWLHLEFPVSVVPDEFQPAPSSSMVSAALASAVASGKETNSLVITSVLQVNSTGICGNGICEIGEMADPNDPIASPGTCPGDCASSSAPILPVMDGPVDVPAVLPCPTPEASSVASPLEQCGGRGTCNGATGACWCSQGYAGPDCSLCADGYTASGGACSITPLPMVEDFAVAAAAADGTEGGTNWSLILLVSAAVGVCLLLAAGAVVFLVWRRIHQGEASGLAPPTTTKTKTDDLPWGVKGGAELRHQDSDDATEMGIASVRGLGTSQREMEEPEPIQQAYREQTQHEEALALQAHEVSFEILEEEGGREGTELPSMQPPSYPQEIADRLG